MKARRINVPTKTPKSTQSNISALNACLACYSDSWSITESEQEKGTWNVSISGVPATFVVTNAGRNFTACDGEYIKTQGDAKQVGAWLDRQARIYQKLDAAYRRLQKEEKSLNAALTPEAATRIKTVFRMAQEAVELPKGFRYTAFRENKSENSVLSTLMYTSAKLNATQWIMKSALMAQFLGEPVEGSRTGEVVQQEAWAFQPNYDPDGRGGEIEGDIKETDKLYTFRPDPNKTIDSDKQAAYWLAGILSDMVEDILQNPPNRVYEYFLADGLLRKKDLSAFDNNGLLRLLSKDVLTGIEVLKAKPSMWRKLLEKGYITGEQAFKAQPDQLAWLAIHNYIPIERALKINPDIQTRLERAGVMVDEADVPFKDVDSLVNAVADGKITPQKAWSINDKVLKPLIEAKLIVPYDAYKLDPSVLNWMLENHYIGREEAVRMKPRIKQEMNKKGVDWETLDASAELNASRPRWMDDDIGLDLPEDIDEGWADDDWEDWEYVKSKEIYDVDGFTTTYTWFSNEDGTRHIFMYGYDDADPDYADWECDSYEEAQNWFENYRGPGDEDLDSARRPRWMDDDIGLDLPEDIDPTWADDDWEEDEEAMQSLNPFGYTNFKVERTPQGTWIVRADSKRFGSGSIVFESYSRSECNNWVKKQGGSTANASKKPARIRKKVNAAKKPTDIQVQQLEGQLRAKVAEVMTSSDFGFERSDVESLTAVEVTKLDDGRVKAEVRAEVTYGGLMKLCDALNPIVRKYDDWAYFEPVTSGIIDAYLFEPTEEYVSSSWNR